jgi:hypothetical protein
MHASSFSFDCRQALPGQSTESNRDVFLCDPDRALCDQLAKSDDDIRKTVQGGDRAIGACPLTHSSMATSTHAAICWQLTHIVHSGLWLLMSGTTRHAPDTRHDAHRRAVPGASSSVRS